MNIFYTNSCPSIAAEQLAYRHVVKMIVESCQMLSAAHHLLGTTLNTDVLYRKTHVNHPSAAWVRQSTEHYDWLWIHAKRMCEIYTQKSGKVHASERILDALLEYPTGLQSKPFVAPPACVDDDLKPLAKKYSVEYAYKVYLTRKYNEWLTREKPMQVEFVCGAPDWFVRERVEKLVDTNVLLAA